MVVMASGSGTDRGGGADRIDADSAASAQAGRQTFQPTDADTAAAYGKGGELDLGGDDIRLPWLEGDDEDFEEQGGLNGQTLLLVMMALGAIVVLVGGGFWMLRDSGDAPLVANGGVIEAPAEPYKTRPQDPGGEVVDGTGDTSFAVAEGQSRTPNIAPGAQPAPAPGFDSMPKPTASAATPAPAPEPAKPQVSGVGVQVGAYTSQSDAEAGWNSLKVDYPALGDVSHRVVKGQADIGTVYRLQAVPGDLAAARRLCSAMKAAGFSCQVKN